MDPADRERHARLPKPPIALSIAGSDPSGGAGIQADLKTFSALGAYGTCVITVLTAQSTQGVRRVHEIPVDVVRAQLETLVADVRVDVVKVGMLASASIASAVGDLLYDGKLARVPVVLDPVMVSTTGSKLLADDAIDAVRALVPRAAVITPNIPEAGVLLDRPIATSVAEMENQARMLLDGGASRVLLKGGHLDAPECTDVWADSSRVDSVGIVRLDAARIESTATHGTGCTLSSAIAALRGRHPEWLPAVREAKAWLTEALRYGEDLHVGSGSGPVHHFHEQPRWN
ncbi:MAG: bifunctional hydroxymethylpyrimidine kinase/phosphomethylpyrimidine kinase [Cumulibacter sp.]